MICNFLYPMLYILAGGLAGWHHVYSAVMVLVAAIIVDAQTYAKVEPE